ncbi:MAG: SDR family oxidoreductase [Methanosarcinales archaeon]
MVTGAFSYTGKYITRLLISIGERVRILTGHPNKENPFGDQVEVFPYNFDKQEELIRSLCGVDTLYNNYWIRFRYGKMNFDRAVDNTKVLVESAQKAKVKKIVHVSITNANKESPLPYFKGKGIVEQFIQESGLNYVILRPTVIFGKEGILINNIAWCLRHFPVFGVFGDGSYRVQPIYVEDLAEIAFDAGHKYENMIIDTAGPEIFTYDELVHLIKNKIHSNTKILHLQSSLLLIFSKILGKFVNDVVITRDEVDGLMADLLYSRDPPKGKTRLSFWLEKNSESVGTEYASELKRHYLPSQKC